MSACNECQSNPNLKLVCYQEQQEAALEKIDAKEEWHEFQSRVILEYVANGFCSADGMASCIDKALR